MDNVDFINEPDLFSQHLDIASSGMNMLLAAVNSSEQLSISLAVEWRGCAYSYVATLYSGEDGHILSEERGSDWGLVIGRVMAYLLNSGVFERK